MDTDVRGVIQHGEMSIKYAMQRRKERKTRGLTGRMVVQLAKLY
jgi:hypothetical protein